MFSLSNQIKSPDDEEEDQPEDYDNSIQQTFLTYNNNNNTNNYIHRFEQTHLFTSNSCLSHNQKSSPVFDSTPMKFNLEKFNFKRRGDGFESHGGGDGRILHSTGRKDRHSKVRTARGPRDRRVRLSPRTAIQFYDVQDRLGYDRPSKAIDWLIKEAKAAIDALNHHSNAAAESHGNPNSGFGFCVDGAPPPPSTADDFNDLILHQNYQQGFCSAFSETNWEIARFQKMLNWNSGNEISGGGGGGVGYSSVYSPPPLHSPAAPISGDGGHILSQREPLQSSFVNYSPMSNADFPAFNFCNELLNVTASATPMKEDEREKKLAFNRPSSSPPFLQYED